MNTRSFAFSIAYTFPVVSSTTSSRKYSGTGSNVTLIVAVKFPTVSVATPLEASTEISRSSASTVAFGVLCEYTYSTLTFALINSATASASAGSTV